VMPFGIAFRAATIRINFFRTFLQIHSKSSVG
jgi:hypothetical protein